MSLHALPCATSLLLLAQALPAAQTLWDSGDPTPTEQYVLELINRARADPVAEGTRLGIDIREGLSPANAAAVGARGPLAMNPRLLQIARAHSQDMWTNSYFAHNSQDGTTPFQRMTAAGYVYSSAGENIACGGNHTAAVLEDLLMVDEGIAGRGHRTNLLDLGISFREVGIGYYHNATANSSNRRDFLTQDFATASTGPLIVGVVYDDSNGNGFYDIGEGRSGVAVTPSSGSWRALTATAGGYAFPAASSGTLNVTFSGGGLAGTITKSVILGTANRKLDARASEAVTTGGSVPATPTSPPTVDNTTSATPTLGGTSEAGASIVIYDGATPVGVATANGSGAWTWTSPTLAVGSHSFTWRASNANGTSGASPATTVTVSGTSGTGSGSSAGGGGGGGCGAGATGLLALLGLGLRRRQRHRMAGQGPVHQCLDRDSQRLT